MLYNDPVARIEHELGEVLNDVPEAVNGDGISTEQEAARVERAFNRLRELLKEADKEHKVEKAPHLEACRRVDTRWKPIREQIKAAAETLRGTLSRWRAAIEAKRREEAERLRREAEEKARAAEEAAKAASLKTKLEAERIKEEAKIAAQKARQMERAPARLRTIYRPEIVDLRKAAEYYWTHERAAFEELVTRLASRDIRAGKRNLPGIRVVEEKVAI